MGFFNPFEGFCNDTKILEAINELEINKANKSDVYNKTETDKIITERVAEIVAGAPEEFDTLKEMSDWLIEHEDSAAAMNTAIQKNTADINNRYTKEEVDSKIDTINGSITKINGNISTINTEISELKDNKMSYSDIETVTEEEFNNLTEKTALYYFIKEE